MRRWQERAYAGAQALAPLFERAVEAESLWPVLQAEALGIGHATNHIDVLPAHEALEVEAIRVV